MTLSEKEAYQKFLKADFEDIAEEHYVTVSDGSQIRVLTTKAPKEDHNGFTFVLVAGWNTVVPGWDGTLMEAVKDFDVVYIETREKGSSRLVKKAKFDMDRFSSDIQEAIEYLQLEENKIVLFTSSFGTLTGIHGLAYKKYSSFLTYMVGPVHRFVMPKGSKYYMYLVPNNFLRITRPIWKWWIRNLKSEDPEQAAKYIRALEEADIKKWRGTGYASAWVDFIDMYDNIDERVFVVGMEKDKMHAKELSLKIHNKLINSTYIDLETNKKTHSAEMVKVIRKHLSEIQDSEKSKQK